MPCVARAARAAAAGAGRPCGCCSSGRHLAPEPLPARRLPFDPLRRAAAAAAPPPPPRRARAAASAAGAEPAGAADAAQPARDDLDAHIEELARLNENFCIIESRDSVRSFAGMQLDELRAQIAARRAKTFLLMEEVRRLRIQLRARGGLVGGAGLDAGGEAPAERFPSSIPFFPPITEATLETYIKFYALAVAGIALFGGLIAPSLEVHLGLGGTSYADFIAGMHLPRQLGEVDPIVASFCGGAVGVLTSLLIVEKNNLAMQARRRCIYCQGAGYLTCGACLGSGLDPALSEPGGAGAPGAASAASAAAASIDGCACADCSGTGRVMCTACLCTGKALSTEHDQRLDPFDLRLTE
jgi:hypothetical protein